MNVLIEQKEFLVSLFVILGTISQFISLSSQQKIDDSKDLVFDKSIAVASSVSALASNSADIILQKDLLEMCQKNKLEVCGSSEFFLQQNISIRDSIRAYAYESPENLKEAVTDYNNVTRKNRLLILLTNLFFYVFMVLAILVNFFNNPKQKNMKTNESLYIKILVWAYEQQEAGFTWKDLTEQFKLSTEQEQWVQKIFRSNMPASENLVNHIYDSSSDDVHKLVITAKGTSVAIDYLNLKETEKSSRRAEKIALVAIITGIVVGLIQIVFK